ncbi:hypothetical protein [Noviherbaspirillum sp.]|uniref:hypothetical protein n=1 Tax=Noviherbaspirillum sp. TaxID=1926288 RepID=UPI002FE31920
MPNEDLSLDELLKNTGDNQEWVRCRIRTLREFPELREKFTTKHLMNNVVAAAGVTEDMFDHFMRGKPLDERAHQALVNYLWRNNWCSDEYRLKEGLARHPDALFYALSAFLETGEQTQRNLREEAVGTYRIWRPSLHFPAPGKCIMGMMRINVDPQSLALRVTETHAYKGNDNTNSQGEIFEGCVVQKSQFLFLIARQIPRHRGPPRITVIHNPHYDDKKGIISSMEGMVTGCYGIKLFSAPVYIERVTDEETAHLPEELDIRDAPDLVAAKLQFNLKNNVIFF